MTTTWIIDPSGSSVGFAVKQLGVATVRGEFHKFEGAIEIGQDVASSRVYGTVMAASVDTKNERRDEHLRSADFLDAARHPELHFRSRRIETVADDAVRILGDLDLHGERRELVLDARVVDRERLALEVTGKLSRRDYGVRWDAALGGLDALVGDTVTLELDIAAVRED